jgi:hypothetical protein
MDRSPFWQATSSSPYKQKFPSIGNNQRFIIIKGGIRVFNDRLCGLVVRVLGYRSGGPGTIPGTTRKKSSGSGTGSTQPREYD